MLFAKFVAEFFFLLLKSKVFLTAHCRVFLWHVIHMNYHSASHFKKDRNWNTSSYSEKCEMLTFVFTKSKVFWQLRVASLLLQARQRYLILMCHAYEISRFLIIAIRAIIGIMHRILKIVLFAKFVAEFVLFLILLNRKFYHSSLSRLCLTVLLAFSHVIHMNYRSASHFKNERNCGTSKYSKKFKKLAFVFIKSKVFWQLDPSCFYRLANGI